MTIMLPAGGRSTHRWRHGAVVVLLIACVAASCTRQTPPAAQSPDVTASSAGPQSANTAPTPGGSPSLDGGPCDAAETQAEMTRCWADEQRAAERRADEAFREATAWLRGRDQTDAAKMFADAHASWARYRDVHCQAVAAVYAGGSMAPMQEAHCRADLAAQRTRALETILADANP